VAARNWWKKLECPIRGIAQYAIRLRCIQKHKLKDPRGKEEETLNLQRVKVADSTQAVTGLQCPKFNPQAYRHCKLSLYGYLSIILILGS
jgi:hypothetical protein